MKVYDLKSKRKMSEFDNIHQNFIQMIDFFNNNIISWIEIINEKLIQLLSEKKISGVL